MKIVVDRFVHEPPGISIVPETDYEAAVLSAYWESAKFSTGRSKLEDQSANGRCYSVTFGFDDPKQETDA